MSFFPELPGFYSYSLEGRPEAHLAAAMLDPSESDLSAKAQRVEPRALEQAREIPKQKIFWHWLVLAALALAAVDWVLFHSGRLA